MKKAPRKNPTPLQKKELQQEAESQCAWCGDENPESWEFHHIDGRRENTVNENLILLCGKCHNIAEVNNGKITMDDLYQRKRELAKMHKNELTHTTKIRNSNIAQNNQNCSIVQNYYSKPPPPPKVAPAADSLEGNTKYKNYAFFLINKLIEYRIEGKEFASDEEKKKESRNIAIAVNSKIKRDFNVTSYKAISMENSEKLFQYLKDLIDKTKQGRINRGKGYQSYMSFEDYNG